MMNNLKAKLEKLQADVQDYEMIAKLATDPERRDAFRRLAAETRKVADQLRTLIAEQG